MSALFLVLLAAAAPATTPPNTVSGVTVQAAPPTAIDKHPDESVDMAGDDIVAPAYSFWPKGAFQIGTDGRVSLACWVDVHGLAERCTVAGESPPNRGFGKAALQLRTTFKLKPTQGPDGPVGATKTINVTFKAPDRNNDAKDTLFGGDASRMTKNANPEINGRIQGNPLRMTDVTMVNTPVWTAAPTFDDLARAYPANGGGVEGYVAAHCRVDRKGALIWCVSVKEDPVGHGFEKAALSLTSRFRLAPETVRASHSGPLAVDVPIRLPPPDSAELKARDVMAPSWIAGFDLGKVQGLFPPEAADRGLTSGRGVARCAVAADGTLSACAPEPGEPDGLGFSEAAVKLASTMKMNLWSADAAPVEGGTVHIPIRLNLKGAPAGTK